MLNFGVPGYALSNEAEQFKVKALPYSPDLIIVGVTLSNEFKENYSSSRRVDCTKNLDFCNLRIETPFHEFYKISSSEKIPILMVILPNGGNILPNGGNTVKQLSENCNFSYLSLEQVNLNKSVNMPDMFLYFPIDGHPSPYGHMVIAEAIYDYLVAKGLLE